MKKSGRFRLTIACIVSLIVFIVVIIFVNNKAYISYQRTYNQKLNSICLRLTDKYSDIRQSDLMSIINDDSNETESFFEKYGIDINNDAVIRENDRLYNSFIVCEIVIIVAAFMLAAVIVVLITKHRDNEIHTILKYIEQINNGNYQLKIDDNEEGELSVLKNEVYKTTIMLKETADNSLKDKLTIKNSLSDISHQLKTPITSLLINLENIEDNIEGDKELTQKLILNSKRDTNSISKLVKSVLELSKFDSNTIEFMRKESDVSQIVNDAVVKVEALADLLDIQIIVAGDSDGTKGLYCDTYWQTEAVANLLKNGVEHAKSYVKIRYERNKVYTKIEVENDGDTISEHDKNHIFERFYKGEHGTKDSLGIGLSMVKAIVENDNGYVTVQSEDGITVFTIKYL